MTPTQRSARKQALNRREVLKALAAIGGAAAASSFLPEKWVKPVVEMGVLPAHAQSSVCSPPFSIDQCADNGPYWTEVPTLTLVMSSMAIFTRACSGVPLRFSFVLKNVAGQVIYSSKPRVFTSDKFGDVIAIITVPYAQMSGIPSSGVTHWEFTNSRYGQMECDWLVSIPPIP